MYIELKRRLEEELAASLRQERQLREDAEILAVMLTSCQREIRRCHERQFQIREALAFYSAALAKEELAAS